jgi:transketolase
LSITADDEIAEVYADGVAMKFQPGGWNIVRTIDIPDDTKVIAVKAIDIAKASTKLMSQLSEQLFRL